MAIPEDGRSTAGAATDRDAAQQRAANIVQSVLRQRSAGRAPSDSKLISLYPELAGELKTELELAAEIRAARINADRAGSAPERLRILTESELDLPIELSTEFGDEDAGSSDPLPQIARYRIEHEISHGGQAVVYKALEESTGRPFAIKVIPGGPLVSSKNRARFDREAKLLATFDHPNIVGIIERGRTRDGSFFFVMQYIDGVTLDAYWTADFARDVEGTRKTAQLFHKIAVAVQAAHERGVVHRDIKPSNIRVDRRGEPHVLDFGLACLAADADDITLKSITAPGQIVGSLPWASPEQVAGTELTPATDVYSLGVMFYQALTGSFPYRLDPPMDQILLRIRTARAEPPSAQRDARPGINAGLDAIVLKCLTKDSAERYATAGDLAEDLNAWLDGKAPRARVAVSRRRNRVLTIGGAVAALCCLAAVVWPFLRTDKPPVVQPLPGFGEAVGMRFLLIPAGSMTLGSPASEQYRDRAERQHVFTLQKRIYVAATEVTQFQYEAIMHANPSDSRWRDPQMPVQNVSWNEAVEFCRRLSALDRRQYRLPTEDEWEYACRATSDGPFNGDRRSDALAWSSENSGGGPHSVQKKWPNRWGLFDMHGNVAEWCSSFYDGDESAHPSEGILMRVVRGGNGLAPANECRSAARAALDPEGRLPTVGFRVVCDQ
jgi:formylglycine-generating enzyme required for sulfatase activity